MKRFLKWFAVVVAAAIAAVLIRFVINALFFGA